MTVCVRPGSGSISQNIAVLGRHNVRVPSRPLKLSESSRLRR